MRRVWLCCALASALVAPVALPAQTAAPAAQATGVILGQVVDADSGRPIGEAIVTLAQLGSPSAASGPRVARLDAQMPGRGRGATIHVLTGADGRFVFT